MLLLRSVPLPGWRHSPDGAVRTNTASLKSGRGITTLASQLPDEINTIAIPIMEGKGTLERLSALFKSPKWI